MNEYKALPLAGDGPATGREVAPDYDELRRDAEYEAERQRLERMQVFTLIGAVAWLVVILAAAFLLTSCSGLPAGVIPRRATITPTPPLPAFIDKAVREDRLEKVMVTDTATVRAGSTPTPARCVVTGTNGERLNIRKSPSTTGEILASVPEDTVLPVAGWDSAEWTIIEYQGTLAYVWAQYCEGK